MAIGEHLEEFCGKSIVQFNQGDSISRPTEVAYRLACEDYDDSDGFSESLAEFLDDPNAGKVHSLVIGCWDGAMESDDSSAAVEMLVSASDQLTGLRALFLGDITYEEQEISWINQTDVSPIFAAYPKLEVFAVRGSNGLTLGSLAHASLKKLIVQCGGLPASVMNEITSAKLPNLEHLELWLGDENYGRGIDEATLAPLLAGGTFPKLKYLGLRNDDEADATAKLVADAAILSQIETLDLSLGALGNDGFAALAASPLVRKLKKLDVSHHYADEEHVSALKCIGIEVDASDPQEEDKYGDDVYRSIMAAE